MIVELKENGENDNTKVNEIADDKNDNGEKNNKNVEIEEKRQIRKIVWPDWRER